MAEASASGNTPQPQDNAGTPEDSSVSEVDKVREENEQLKKRLSTAEGRARVSSASIGHMEELEQRVMRAQQGAMEIMLNSDLDTTTRENSLKEHYTRMGGEQVVAAQITRAQPELEKLIADAGLNWGQAPELANARGLWEQRRPDEALRAARDAVRELNGVFTRDEVSQIIEDKMKNNTLSEGRVDMGQSTASGTGGRNAPLPTTRAELVSYLGAQRAAGNIIGKDKMTELISGIQRS